MTPEEKRERNLAAVRRYRATEKGREGARAATRRYRASEKGRATLARKLANAPAKAAARLLRGDRIMWETTHHTGVAFILGPRPEGAEVSRICPNDCPDIWIGYARGRRKIYPYRLCIPEHYIYESKADNLARRGRD